MRRTLRAFRQGLPAPALLNPVIVMRYEDVRRLRGTERFWFRLGLWLRPPPWRRKPVIGNLSHLSDHERRDIGLPEPVRYVDWRELKQNGGS